MGSINARQNRAQRLAWGVCLLVALGMSGVTPAEESPLIENIDQLMIDIGAQLTNAKKRLSMSSGIVEENPNGESGIGLTCCTDNLRTIAEKLRGIRASIETLAVYFTEQENGRAISILGEMDIQLQSISTGAAIFGRSPDEKHAAAALTGFVRPWNAFRNGVQALRLCCPVPLPLDAAAESESDSGGQGKKKGA